MKDEKHKETIYFHGDKVELTGKKEMLHGGLFAQGFFVEGHKKGQEGWFKATGKSIEAEEGEKENER